MFGDLSGGDLAWVGVCVFVLGMGKGGLPLGAVALPLLLLVWPTARTDITRDAAGFMLPLLCAMDVVAVWMYRRHVRWAELAPLAPACAAGILVGTLVLASRATVSDRVLQCGIGTLGITYVVFEFARSRLRRSLAEAPLREATWWTHGCGLLAGVVSTVAHAAGPVAWMYYLTRRLDKKAFAATLAAFFLCLNAAKLPSYAALGMLKIVNLKLALALSPLIPLGVGAGYWAVHRLHNRAYFRLIHLLLLATSLLLILRALGLA